MGENLPKRKTLGWLITTQGALIRYEEFASSGVADIENQCSPFIVRAFGAYVCLHRSHTHCITDPE